MLKYPKCSRCNKGKGKKVAKERPEEERFTVVAQSCMNLKREKQQLKGFIKDVIGHPDDGEKGSV